MGGTVSIDAAQLEVQLERFKSLVEEGIGTRGWEDREVLGVHTRLSSKVDDNSNTYWRGVVDVDAPLELILWVIRNQTETFDALSEVSVRDYLDPEVAEFVAKRACEASVENAQGIRTLRWTQELPPPARKREFVTTEVVHQMGNATFVIQTSEAFEGQVQRECAIYLESLYCRVFVLIVLLRLYEEG